MSANNPPPPYHVQSKVDDPQAFAHHSSVSALWEEKWKQPCSMGIYPFVHGKIEDFEPIIEQLKVSSNDEVSILYQPDEYAKAFIPVGEKLVQQGEEAEKAGNTAKAKEFYLRAAAVYRIARFPINRSPLTQKAWQLNKATYFMGSRYLNPPVRPVLIPFKHANTSAGDQAIDIAACLRIPNGEVPAAGWPVILWICGLDAYRIDEVTPKDGHIENGSAVLRLDIPGTGDCPAAPRDPKSADRLWSSVLDWIGTVGKEQYDLDDKRVIARGISTGGYYAFRIAHTHADRLLGAIGHGGWSHYTLNEDWIKAMNHMEYPFDLAGALAHKFGYKSVEELIASKDRFKFSLKNSDMLDQPCCRLLVINGMEDSIFPIEDSILVATRGKPKDVRIVEGREHMGFPEAEGVILEWINGLVAGQ